MEDYIGTINLWACDFEPRGWKFCHGQQLTINRYQALYALLGTRFGGDGRTTFNLPDMRGRFPLGVATSGASTLGGQRVNLAQTGGSTTSPVTSTAPATKVDPATDAAAVAVSNAVAANATAGNATNTLNPYLGLNYIICVDGIFPSRADD
ncbi:MAG: hypothetical protein RIR79_1344 [Pseudomonadota bacterium]|jgi:microcystin-dependent protein